MADAGPSVAQFLQSKMHEIVAAELQSVDADDERTVEQQIEACVLCVLIA